MGNYTEIFVNVNLKPETPENVIETLKAVCAKEEDSSYLENRPYSWALLFNNGSYYTPLTECGLLTFDDIANQYSLLGKGDIKNYGEEIEEFFEYIEPWCEDTFIGYIRYEGDPEPTLIYK